MKTSAITNSTAAMEVFISRDGMLTAISTASRPNSVVNLMTGLSATDEVSL